MRPFRFAVSGLVLFAAGCGGSSPSGLVTTTCPLPADGTRLKAFRIQADDGASEDVSRYGTWYDAQLGVPCRFDTAADDVLRCLPRVAPPSSNLYADAACSQRVAFGGRCKAPAYVTVDLPTRCAAGEDVYPYAVYAAGPGVVPDVLYRQQTDAAGDVSCTGEPNSDARQVFPLLSEVPPTEFVAGTVERVGGPRIQSSEIAAADGARGREPSFVFDSSFGSACDLQLAADGEWRCLPLDAVRYQASYFADTTCTQPLVGKPARSCDPDYIATYAGIEEPVVCGTINGEPIRRYPGKTHVHQIDPATIPAQLFAKSYDGANAICEAQPNDAAQPYSRLRAELAPTEFARATVQEVSCSSLGRSGRRLKAYDRVFEDGTVLGRPSFGVWVDADSGQDCWFTFATDGVLRCLPRSLLYVGGTPPLFADAACSQAVLPVNRCAEYPLGPPKFAVSDEFVDECTPAGHVEFRRRVRALGAAVTPAALYTYDETATPARCVPIEQAGLGTTAEILQRDELRPLGSEVPPATFVAGSLATP